MATFIKQLIMNQLLLILLLVCHYLGDFTHLSRPYMLQAKRFGTPLKPIWDHAFIHATLMWFTCYFFTNYSTAFGVFCMQFMLHGLIDITKGRINYCFPVFQDSSKYPYWYLFGLDQLLHILIIIYITTLI